MQTVNWEHSAYNELVTAVAAPLKDVQKDGSEPIFDRISSKDGDNFPDLSKKSSSYSSGEYRPWLLPKPSIAEPSQVLVGTQALMTSTEGVQLPICSRMTMYGKYVTEKECQRCLQHATLP
jgi:hypothetical protein